jgi:hypothetical protein
VTFWGTVEIDETGDAYRFTGSFEIVDPAGLVMLSDRATAQGQRMHGRYSPSPGSPSSAFC